MKLKLITLLAALPVFHFSFAQTDSTKSKSDTVVTYRYTWSAADEVMALGFDTTITGFHYATNFSGTVVYTPNGAADLNTLNPSAFSFTILHDATYKYALSQIRGLLKMSDQDGFIRSGMVEKDTVINGIKAYYVSFTETRTDNDYQNLVFDAFYIKDKTAVLFVSGDLDKGKHIENFKKTFYGLKL